jgi:hypothetical protein
MPTSRLEAAVTVRVAAVAILAGVALCSAAAVAQEPAPSPAGALVAVLPPDFSGSVSEGARARLLQRLVEGLKVARFDVVSGPGLLKRLGGDATALSCRTPDCYPALARRLRVAYLVRATIGQVERNYDISLTVVRGRSGESAAELRERCDICGIEEVAEKMGLAASSLRAKLEALVVGPARLTVRSTPSGAYVYLDGKEIGRTPLEREIPGGPHTLRFRHRGYMAAERTVTLVPEIAETVDVTLLRAAATFPYASVGWSAVAVGALALGAGAAMVAIDGRVISCAPAEQDGLGNCPKVRDTRALGAVLAGLGAALVTGGGLSVWIGRDRGSGGGESPRAARWRPSVAPLPGGAQVGLERRF